MRTLARNLIVGSRIEPFARRLVGHKNWFYDRQTIEVMRRVLSPGSGFVDVGCHSGELLRQAMSICPSGEFWAFEPLPDLFLQLQRDFPDAHLFNVALSDDIGEVEFNYFPDEPQTSGLAKRKGHGEARTISVRTATLDSILKARAVKLVKIDVEGAELLVLRGAVASLSTYRPVVIFECGLGGLNSYGHTPDEVFDVFSSCGLKVSTMQRWLSRPSAFSRKEFSEWFHSGRDFYYIAF